MLSFRTSELNIHASSGWVVWITGLSGSGKSTLAGVLRTALEGRGERAVLLDGDEMRDALSSLHTEANPFGPEARLRLANAYARLARLLESQGFIVIVATISLFHEIHRWNRENLARYVAVLLEVPESELRARDPKGIYSASESGKTRSVTGIDLEAQFPTHPHIRFSWDQQLSPVEMAEEIVRHILEAGGIRGDETLGGGQ